MQKLSKQEVIKLYNSLVDAGRWGEAWALERKYAKTLGMKG